jgi:protease IV
VGSIGTMAVVEDFSGVAEKRGIKVHVISTGPYKGAGVSGAPITDAQLAYFQARVDAVNQHFLNAVSVGRDVALSRVQEWADGRVWIADAAKQMGMIDGVMLFDEAMDGLRQRIERGTVQAEPPAPRRDVRAAIAAMEKIIL